MMINQATPLSRSTNKEPSPMAYGSNETRGQSANMLTDMANPNGEVESPPIAYTTTNQYENSNYWNMLSYYLPCLSWIPEYTSVKLLRDLIAGISLASFQIPLALSYATSIAHVHPLSGLYSLAITPLIYGVLGSVPQMIVGPEAAISLVVGQGIDKIKTARVEELNAVDVATVITLISGLTLFASGLGRFGFLGNVLSTALLRGFISSVGLVMIINSAISELKLSHLLDESTDNYNTPFKKLLFLLKYGPTDYHAPTLVLSSICLFILLTCRILKKSLIKQRQWLVFVPEILIVVITTILLSMKYRFKHTYGISNVGDFNAEGFGKIINPINKKKRKLYPELLSTGLLTALLGFFESTTASKSLGHNFDLTVSSNRELIALGTMNIFGSLFGALPAFGGYGRSKINAFSGAQTVMSGAFVGMITLFTLKYLLSLIHYIPVCVLSVITTLVGVSLLEEAPAEIAFHIRCKGYHELTVFCLTFLSTFFYSIEAGIFIGSLFSVLNIIRHSTKSRIQILGRTSKSGEFINIDELIMSRPLNIESNPNLASEEYEGCLVVRIPEPLTFTNSEDLKERLGRIERYGSVNTHPGTQNLRSKDKTKFIVFDMNGVTSMDSSAAQILLDIIKIYCKRSVRVFLVSVPRNENVRTRLMKSGITNLLKKNGQRVPMSFEENNINDDDVSCYYPSSIDDAFVIIDDIITSSSNSEIPGSIASSHPRLSTNLDIV